MKSTIGDVLASSKHVLFSKGDYLLWLLMEVVDPT